MNSETSTNQIAFNLLQKAHNKFEANKYATALQYCQAALAIYQEIGDRAGVAYTLTNIGNIYRKQAVYSYEEALSTFSENSIQISEEIAQIISSPLETQLDWYGSNNGNTELLGVTNPDEYWGDDRYWGDNRPSKSDHPVGTNGDDQH
ncbi:tetratricopeptide repeat protein [Microcoleus sp. MON1_C1]|uniref:tetratricopeptide repeat protein n=1 Tax=Microcoleus sp. MON1_C1 TaxID=2818827 RepID=UPI002FD168FB